MDDTTDERSSVNAKLTFLVKTGQKPYVHTEALTGDTDPHYFAEQQEREVTIHNGRLRSGGFSLDRHGFELHERATEVEDLYDDTVVETRYYTEVEALLQEITGASRVVIFDHTRRTDAEQRGIRGPAQRVHNDYTDRSIRERVSDVLGAEGSALLKSVPFAQINLWRPIRGPVIRSPLAMIDASTLDPDDLMATDLVYPDRTGEIYHLAYNPGQRWTYFPDMRREEVVLIKGYDSRDDGRARFTPHTAFLDPTTRPDAPPRESIEVRTLVFFA